MGKNFHKSSECDIVKPEILQNDNQELLLTKYPNYFPFADHGEKESMCFEQGFSYSYGWLLIPMNSFFSNERFRPLINPSNCYRIPFNFQG